MLITMWEHKGALGVSSDVPSVDLNAGAWLGFLCDVPQAEHL